MTCETCGPMQLPSFLTSFNRDRASPEALDPLLDMAAYLWQMWNFYAWLLHSYQTSQKVHRKFKYELFSNLRKFLHSTAFWIFLTHFFIQWRILRNLSEIYFLQPRECLESMQFLHVVLVLEIHSLKHLTAIWADLKHHRQVFKTSDVTWSQKPTMIFNFIFDFKRV